MKLTCPHCSRGARLPDGTPIPAAVRCPHCERKFQPVATVPDPHPVASSLKDCIYCGEQIQSSARKCRYCGEILDPALRAAEEAKSAVRESNSPFVINNNLNANANAAVTGHPNAGIATGQKSRTTAVVLALLLGGIGAHKFYLGQAFQGIVYLFFFWTFIPAIVALIEGLSYLGMSDQRFWKKYG